MHPLADYGALQALVLPRREARLAIQSALLLAFPLYSYRPSNRGRPCKQGVSERGSPVPCSGGTARECWKQSVRWGIGQRRGLGPGLLALCTCRAAARAGPPPRICYTGNHFVHFKCILYCVFFFNCITWPSVGSHGLLQMIH